MDKMVEATAVAKDKIYIFFGFATQHLYLHLDDFAITVAKINICIDLENKLFFISLKLVQTKYM